MRDKKLECLDEQLKLMEEELKLMEEELKLRGEELVDKEMKLEEKKVKVKVSEDSLVNLHNHQLKCILCLFHRNHTHKLNKYKKS